MIASSAWAGKRFAVLGLARSGKATVAALVEGGASVVAWDSNEEARQHLPGTWSATSGAGQQAVSSAASPLHPQPAAGGPPPRAGEVLVADPLTIDLTGFAGVIVSPGVPLNRHPIAAHAASAGVPILGDIELFAQARAGLPPHKVVGITGTNGKSTTTALIHHILETAGVPTTLGGNIGLPILGQDPLPEGGIYVIELSSYQIDLTTTLDCEVAVLLNLTPDHLDRYASFQAYADSKARLFAMQSARHAAIVGIGDEASAAIARDLSRGGRVEDVTKIAPGICMDQSRWPALQGPHNAQNALAAIAACEALGIDRAAIDAGLATFPGLPHRTQFVAEVNGVRFVDDSKATNPESVAPALRAFDRVHWILGGVAKTDNLEACRPGFAHVAAAYTIGEAAPLFERLLDGEFPVESCGTMDVAVARAAAAAKPGETVLLSPACASFDQFSDYAARGRAFADAVGRLA